MRILQPEVLTRATFTALLLVLLVSAELSAQFGFRGPRREDLLPRFDTSGNGRVEGSERIAARAYARSRQGLRSTAGEFVSRPPALERELRVSALAAPSEHTDLYDPSSLRTLYLRFPSADWYEELGDFYGTEVDVPADLVVDGRLYKSVGVHFRGNSSYSTVGGSPKKSLGISIDYTDGRQRLLGYRTLNLLNAHTDPSFVREVLYYHVARTYIPAPRANFVRLVINGESFGVYANVQQINKDFLAQWFGRTDGVRWKVPASRGGGGGLAYYGDDVSRYAAWYALQTGNAPEAWDDLVDLLQVLDEAPQRQDAERLESVLNVDEALWYLALENVFTDSDGYLSRGSDFAMYQDAGGRFFLLPHDNNETFRYVGGGGPNTWPTGDPMLSPLVFEDTERRPLIRALFSFPAYRARYLAHVRTLVEVWLDWGVLGPIVERYHALIDGEVRADDKKLYTYEAFVASRGSPEDAGGYGFGGGAPDLRRYVEDRRDYLLGHDDVARAVPEIGSLKGVDVPPPARVVINEIMAANSRGPRDPQGDADDWVELYNPGGSVVDLGGMYLSDRPEEPRRWTFPTPTLILPRGYLVIWADKDIGASPGLHAAFRLSSAGEHVLLVDTDARVNRVLDRVEFSVQGNGLSLGRAPDGTGGFVPQIPTLGTRNR